MEHESLKSKVILLPQTDRDFNYARWKSQPAIEPLRCKGLSSSLIEQELKIIHNLSCAAYYRSDTVCNKLSLQILAGFALSLSSIAFIIFVATLLVFALYHNLKSSIQPEHYEELTLYIMEHVTPRSISMVCGICSVICIMFGALGAYIIYKSHRNKLNQYVECILAVHEHIYSRLSTKYEEHGIVWKIITHKKDSKRISVLGSKQDITYYGIVIKLKDDNDEEYNDDELDVDLHDIQSQRAMASKYKKRSHGHQRMQPSNSDMSINEDYYDRNSKLNQKHDERKLAEHMKVNNAEPQQQGSWNHSSSSNSIFSRNNSNNNNHPFSRNNSSHRVRDRFLTDKTDKSLEDLSSPSAIKVDHVPLLLKMSMSNVSSGNEPRIIGSRIKLTD
eukprot:CAMPEP_0197075848 /NCGR_PEP_ID=MMETSP1384-20130603/211819_1 /TAXON_ID=29189 /ORGANISM="Ammonia sp." /LENGTH=388 /DNA_ID=CAMNT_0042514697 /DNA_START=33 /DNA_END=1199 /DNA_ORIENTATION=-